MADVRLAHVSYNVGSAEILRDLDLSFRKGVFNAILGPNGAGKSTLMRIAAGRLAATSGEVLYAGVPIASLDSTALARRRAVLSQQSEMAFPLSVEDVVLMGRYPHYRAAPSPRDLEIVAEALALVDMADRRHQAYPTLSGGERQKTHLARVLAQIWDGGDCLLFLDEPTTSLDIHYQIQLLDTAKSFLARGCTIVATLHDLSMAFDYGDRFYLMEKGSLVHESADPIPKEIIERVYRVRVVEDRDENRARWRFRL